MGSRFSRVLRRSSARRKHPPVTLRPWGLSSRLALLAALLLMMPAAGEGQPLPRLSGIVQDAASGVPVAGAEVTLLGFGTQVSDSLGAFDFGPIPAGDHVLRLRHLAYGTHEQDVALGPEGARVEVRISQAAIELSPLRVEADRTDARALGYQQNRISREELAGFEGTTMDLGDILTYRIPGIRIKRDNVLMGLPYCIEFRGASSGNFLRGRGTTDPGCNSPEVYLDGVLVSNPSSLYPSIPVETVESIEVIPPSEAGSRFGTGALWGAIVIESRRPGLPWSTNAEEETPPAPAVRFDWNLEPEDHRGGRVFLSALAANAAGVALGLALSNECIRFRNPGFDSIVSDCSGEGTMLAAAAGVAIPAISAAAAARWTGDTELSRGRFMAASIGAAVALIPGYAFLISSRRDGSGAVEAMGGAMLLIGPPSPSAWRIVCFAAFGRTRGGLTATGWSLALPPGSQRLQVGQESRAPDGIQGLEGRPHTRGFPTVERDGLLEGAGPSVVEIGPVRRESHQGRGAVFIRGCRRSTRRASEGGPQVMEEEVGEERGHTGPGVHGQLGQVTRTAPHEAELLPALLPEQRVRRSRRRRRSQEADEVRQQIHVLRGHLRVGARVRTRGERRAVGPPLRRPVRRGQPHLVQ